MTKISVIVPVYNTHDYLNECIDSVLNQSLADFELICIDDGSTDDSLDILKDYEKKDTKVQVISQENRGLGASRNVGLNIAQGEYVMFLDSDDYLKSDALEKLYNEANNNDLDLVLFKIINFNNKTGKQSRSEYFDMKFLKDIVKDDIFTWVQVKERIFDISVTATSKLFKRELISDIAFPEGLIFEDNLFFIKVIFKANSVYFYDDYFYYRRIRPDSITNSYYSEYSDCIVIYDRIIEFVKSIGKYDEFDYMIFNRQCFDLFHRFKLLREEYKEDYFNKLKDSFANYKEELEEKGTLDKCSKRSVLIFEKAINSNDYHEFESAIIDFDLKSTNDNQKSKKEPSAKKNQGHKNIFTGILGRINRKA